MKKTELENLIKKELTFVKENQSYSDFEEAKENIACETFTEHEWDYESSAMDSLEEDLNNMTVVEDDSETIEYFMDKLKRMYAYDVDNLETMDSVELKSLINDIKLIREETIYMSDYREFWTEF